MSGFLILQRREEEIVRHRIITVLQLSSTWTWSRNLPQSTSMQTVSRNTQHITTSRERTTETGIHHHWQLHRQESLRRTHSLQLRTPAHSSRGRERQGRSPTNMSGPTGQRIAGQLYHRSVRQEVGSTLHSVECRS